MSTLAGMTESLAIPLAGLTHHLPASVDLVSADAAGGA